MKNLTSVRLITAGLLLGIGSCLEQQNSGAHKMDKVLVTSICSMDVRILESQEHCCDMGICNSRHH